MPIPVTCEHCQAAFKAKDTAAGMRGRCPRCQKIIAIPSLLANRPVPRSSKGQIKRELQLQDIIRAFEGEIEPIRATWLYRFGLFCVAVAMILLPIIYVAL